MQSPRHFIWLLIIIIGVMILNACSMRRLNDNVSTTLPPDNLLASPGNEPTRTPSATRTPKVEGGTSVPVPTHSFTPTLDLARYANSWTRYHGNYYGISFEYPSIYEEKPYNDICKAVESLDGADFGEKSEVYVRQPLGTTLDEHVKAYLANLQFDEPLKLESQEEIEINKQPAIVIEYKLGEAGESREFVFVTVPDSDLIYTFSFIGGSACEVPEIGLSERTVFEYAVETFYVEK